MNRKTITILSTICSIGTIVLGFLQTYVSEKETDMMLEDKLKERGL